jgi:hypothetical protein
MKALYSLELNDGKIAKLKDQLRLGIFVSNST